jgi:RNA polymerase sigma-70 factor, ECF subfamily
MERSDAALVESCMNGDQEAFRELVVRHQGSVFNLAYRLTRSATEAEDLAQEAFVRAYRKLSLYRPAYSFRNWVMTICANTAKNRFRGNIRRRRAEEEHLGRLEPGREGGYDERRALIESGLAALPDTYRVPLVLRHVEGLSYEEIAGILSIGLSAAKMRAARGREALAEYVAARRKAT